MADLQRSSGTWLRHRRRSFPIDQVLDEPSPCERAHGPLTSRRASREALAEIVHRSSRQPCTRERRNVPYAEPCRWLRFRFRRARATCYLKGGSPVFPGHDCSIRMTPCESSPCLSARPHIPSSPLTFQSVFAAVCDRQEATFRLSIGFGHDIAFSVVIGAGLGLLTSRSSFARMAS